MITRLKTRPYANAIAAPNDWTLQPALKICVTSALSKKDIEKAGITIRHAITKIMQKRSNKAI
jgi:serine palmitoyltransferase